MTTTARWMTIFVLLGAALVGGGWVANGQGPTCKVNTARRSA
jgi:hypothetical protein